MEVLPNTLVIELKHTALGAPNSISPLYPKPEGLGFTGHLSKSTAKEGTIDKFSFGYDALFKGSE